MNRHWIALACALCLGGCVSDGYKEFYHPAPGVTPERLAEMRAAPAPATPQLQQSSDNPQAIYEAFGRRGYVAIGYSSFNGAAGQSEQNALKQGARLGADVVVVVDPHYAGTRTGAIPITTPTAQTSYTSGTATAYGSGGSATAFGNAVTTTYGSQTSYVPFSIDRFNYGAIYLVKRHYIFGANYRALNDAERQQLQTNRGLVVTMVVDGSPAFVSDILVGDILMSVDGQPVVDQEQFSQLLRSMKGQQVEVSIRRNGAAVSKTVALQN